MSWRTILYSEKVKEPILFSWSKKRAKSSL